MIIALGLLVIAAPAGAASVCLKLQYRIAAEGAKAKAACYAKAAGSGVPVNSTCLANAEQMLALKWAKATARGDCATSADAATAQTIVDAFLADLVDALDPPISHCCNSATSCFAGPVIDASTCLELNGTLGPPGTVCEGATGTCVAPPGTGGSCCTLPQGYSSCTAGSSVDPDDCASIGGSAVPGAVCPPSGICTVP
jgi:hypothetical protein